MNQDMSWGTLRLMTLCATGSLVVLIAGWAVLSETGSRESRELTDTWSRSCIREYKAIR
jgi:hypothetical protein